jgi:flagellar hook protein FlgE
MMKSLSSAVSGLKAQQTAMNVIGNNIANVNTSGYRSSSTEFEDLFYETLSAGSDVTNPSQIGYGSTVQGVSKNMTSGGATTTDDPDDLYINGDGYFAVCTSATDSSGNATTTPSYYTRVGNLSWNENGYLVDGNGNYVMGTISTDTSVASTALAPIRLVKSYYYTSSTDSSTGVTTKTNANVEITPAIYGELRDITFNTDGSITATYDSKNITITSSSGSVVSTKIALATFVNENGLSAVGNNNYSATAASGAAVYGTASNGNTTKIQSDALESSNTDIATEFTTMITTQRGFQANSRVITTSDTMLEELINLKRS